MRKIDKLLLEYGESHQNVTNKTIHWICVPLIFWSVVAMIFSIPNGLLLSLMGEGNLFANWAVVLFILVLVYYVSLSISLSIGMLLVGVACFALTNVVISLNVAPVWMVALIVFVLAWIGQFYGHKVEGKKPSFFKDLQFLLIGPAWLMHFIFKRLGIPY